MGADSCPHVLFLRSNENPRITRTTRIFLALVLRKRSHRNQSSEFRGNLDGCFGVAYGKKSLEEIFLKKLLRKKYFFAMIYMLAQIITKKTSNYCRLLILRYLLQMEVYSPLYILHLHFLGQMKILHYLLVWLYNL